jgi:hypothetical protein
MQHKKITSELVPGFQQRLFRDSQSAQPDEFPARAGFKFLGGPPLIIGPDGWNKPRRPSRSEPAETVLGQQRLPVFPFSSVQFNQMPAKLSQNIRNQAVNTFHHGQEVFKKFLK